MRRLFFRLALLLIGFGMPVWGYSIFILHSYAQEYPWTKKQQEAFLAHLAQQKLPISHIAIESLDTKRIQLNDQNSEEIYRFLAHKYANFKPDAIYVTDDDAIQFMLQYGEKLFGKTPLFFSGVNTLSLQSRLDSDRYSGVFEAKDIVKNIRLLQSLYPNKQKIHLFGDDSTTFFATKSSIMQYMATLGDITLNFVSDTHIDTILSMLQKDPNTPVLLVTIGAWRDENNHAMPLDTILERVTSVHHQIFAMEDTYIRHGVIGGYVTHATTQGTMAAQLLADYLSRRIMGGFVTQNVNRFLFDEQALLASHLSLPLAIASEASYINRTPHWFDRWKEYIGTLLGLVVALLLFILMLSYYFMRKSQHLMHKHAQKLLMLENSLAKAQEVAQFGHWTWECTTQEMQFSDAMYALLEIDTHTTPSYALLLEHVHPADRDYFQTHIDALRGGKSLKEQFTARFVTTSKKRLSLTILIESSTHNGKPVHIFGLMHDTTLTLIQSNELSLDAQILQSITDGVFVFDSALHCIFVNQSAITQRGYTQEELLKSTPSQLGLFWEEFNERILLQHASQHNKVYWNETTHLRKDGTRFAVEVYGRITKLHESYYFIVVVRDISKRTSILQAYENSLKEHQALLDNAVVGIYKTDIEGNILYINDAVPPIFNATSKEEILSKSLPAYYKNPLQRKEFLYELQQKGFVRGKEITLLTTDFQERDLLISAHLTNGSTISGMMIDITHQKAVSEHVDRLSKTLDQIDDIVIIANPSGTVYFVNEAFSKHTGYEPIEIIGHSANLLKSGEHGLSFYKNMWKELQQGHIFRARFTNRKKDGTIYYEEKTITPIKDARGQITNFVSTAKDITQQIKLTQELERLATTDSLTGLINRGHFEHLYDREIKRARRHKTPTALLIFDIDFFKVVNDTYGHDIGDAILRRLAQVVQENLRTDDIFARWGGEEFVVLLPQTAHEGAHALALKLLKTVQATPFEPLKQLTISIGMSMARDDDTLISHFKRADNALLEAKTKGRNCLIVH